MTQGTLPKGLEMDDDRLVFDEDSITHDSDMPERVGVQWAALIKTNSKRLMKLAIALLIGLAIYHYQSAPPWVKVMEVNAVSATQTLGATGKVRGERVTDLGVDTSGLVKHIYVHEGDSVQAGQLIMSLDNSEAYQRVVGARAALDSALADYDKARRGPLPSEINRAKAEIAQAESVGNARIAQTQAKMRNLNAGTRPQDIAAARAELNSKNELLKKAQKDLQRTQTLVSQGALARANLDDAQTNVETARSAVIAQQDRVSLLEAGPRSDEVVEARAEIDEAKATRDTSARAARESLKTLLATPRPEDIASALARVNEARAELRRTQDAMGKSDLRAPFAGVVAAIPVEEGREVSPGDKLATFQEMGRPVIEVETDEDNLNDLFIGQVATVTSDAYPDKEFKATVIDLGGKVNPDRGTITIKLRPISVASWLKPDLTVDVNIVTRGARPTIMVPPDALTRYAGASAVLVVRDGKAVPVTVNPGARGKDGIVVTGDLKNGDLVVRNASQVRPKGKVRVDTAAVPNA